MTDFDEWFAAEDDLDQALDGIWAERRPAVDAERMMAELRDGVDRLEARRQAQHDRLAARRAQGLAAYERAQAARGLNARAWLSRRLRGCGGHRRGGPRFTDPVRES